MLKVGKSKKVLSALKKIWMKSRRVAGQDEAIGLYGVSLLSNLSRVNELLLLDAQTKIQLLDERVLGG